MTEGGFRRSKDDAAKLIKTCLHDDRIITTYHFRCELENEHLTLVDAHIVIRRGHVTDEPECDARTGQWKYRIYGTAPEGQFVTIVFCFNSGTEAVLITVFSEGA